jgi:hypothetical protein
LIMLIVFLAVPALQRNSRNTQRKNDVSSVLGAVNEYTSNNSGALPTTSAQVLSNAKLGYFSGGAGTGSGQVNLVAGATTLTTSAADDRIVIATGAQCSGSAAILGSARQVVVLYQTETSGTPTVTCQQS